MGKIGYLREVKLGGKIGRIYPADKVKVCGYKIKVEVKKLEWKRSGSNSSCQ